MFIKACHIPVLSETNSFDTFWLHFNVIFGPSFNVLRLNFCVHFSSLISAVWVAHLTLTISITIIIIWRRVIKHLQGILLSGRNSDTFKWFVCAFIRSLRLRIHRQSASADLEWRVCDDVASLAKPPPPPPQASQQWMEGRYDPYTHRPLWVSSRTSDIQVHFKFTAYRNLSPNLMAQTTFFSSFKYRISNENAGTTNRLQ